MSIRFDIDPTKLRGNRRLVAWYRLFGAEFIANAQAIAAARVEGGTGVYERSFVVELIPGNPPRLHCGNKAPHAIYVEHDTRPHPITPTNKKALRWFDPPPAKGRKKGNAADAVFAQRVKHPGTKGQHIVRDAVKITGQNLKRGSHRAAFVS